MKKKTGLSLVVVYLLVLTAPYAAPPHPTGEPQAASPQQPYRRLISLAPSITETLFALGLGEQVVGVTRYCTYPPKALTKARIGGYLDPNIEAIVALRPDLVITFPGPDALMQKLEQMQITVLQISHPQTVSDILSSIHLIGQMTGKLNEAELLLQALQARVAAVKRRTVAASRPRVLVVMARPLGVPPKEVFIAGPRDPYDEMIRIAGGINAYQGRQLHVPPLSTEGIVYLNPDVIIDLASGRGVRQGADEDTILQDWAHLSRVTAVAAGRVHLFSDDFDTVPGPRFILTLEKMARILHPPNQEMTP